MAYTTKKHHELLKVIMHCPSCNEMLRRGKLVEGKDTACLTHFQCGSCLHFCLSLVFRTQVGISTVVLVTDLSFEDVVRMRNKDYVTSDEVINLHELLNRNDAALMLVVEKKEVQ